MHIVYLALGTNLGDRVANLRAARDALPPVVVVEACSSIYETPPWGYTEQPAFLNQVLRGCTRRLPQSLLAYLKRTENQLGRQKSFHYGPRLIDIDILYYDQLVLQSESLTIPHPHMAQRAFVCVPLAEIAPNLRHPVLGVTSQELLSGLDINGVTLYAEA
ncbi:MAG: 2-amino-4-hydroxy-6-hydroxymethyldihydropteridine diphosphokinase [Anaerolineales bacterium]|nr:2-amino-4-hydroxy-6-hydroxymethyldihydropteridine diphosphokinase [Anaerolineales bacterium]